MFSPFSSGIRLPEKIEDTQLHLNFGETTKVILV